MIRTDDARKDAKTMKIVFCGPPHSGKSIFLQGLTANTPHDDYYLFRSCPDGEGTWTYSNSGDAEKRLVHPGAGELVRGQAARMRPCPGDPGRRRGQDDGRKQKDNVAVRPCGHGIRHIRSRAYALRDVGRGGRTRETHDRSRADRGDRRAGAAQDSRPRTWKEERNGSGGAGKTRPEAMTPNDGKHQRRTKRKEKSITPSKDESS